jgi:hypothetical protein
LWKDGSFSTFDIYYAWQQGRGDACDSSSASGANRMCTQLRGLSTYCVCRHGLACTYFRCNIGPVWLVQEPNIRYLALENLTRLALVPEVLESIREHQVRATTKQCRLGACGSPRCVSRQCIALHAMRVSLCRALQRQAFQRNR